VLLSKQQATYRSHNLLKKTLNISTSTARETIVTAAKKGRDHLAPDIRAVGGHSVFKRNPITNKITHYETYIPQTNPRDPKPWEFVKRYDCAPVIPGEPIPTHYNKVLKKHFAEPHIHDPLYPGGVRDIDVLLQEIP